jgi:hypothetical protein
MQKYHAGGCSTAAYSSWAASLAFDTARDLELRLAIRTRAALYALREHLAPLGDANLPE